MLLTIFKMPLNKGSEIRFVKGTYAGMHGWIDKDKKKKKGSAYRNVIVDYKAKDGDDEDGIYQTRVKESSYRKLWTQPKTFEEAALQQHPDIEKAMITLAEMFAQCGSDLSNDGVLQLFHEELTRAKAHIKGLGSKARYRYVLFGGENTI